MAQRTGEAARRRMRGGTALGFLLGLIVGLAVAVVVAIFVTRAPIPFSTKAKRAPDRVLEPKSQSEAPDPNAPLYSKPSAAQERTSPAPAGSAPGAPIVESAPSRAAPERAAAAPAELRDGERAGYILQAGAFRSSSDAEAMKARLALIGFEARVASAEVNGQALYRVRIGPYAQLDAMNRAKARLAENGIDASAVRQR